MSSRGGFYWVSDGKAVEALTFDEEFLRVRGPLTLLCMVLGMVLFVVVTVAGRWSPGLREAEMAGNVFTAVVFAVVLLGVRSCGRRPVTRSCGRCWR